ncbi:Protein COBRA [Linum grandiflorum]
MDSSWYASLLAKLCTPAMLLFFLLSSSTFISTEAYDALDPNGNITIKWDIVSWTPDGYVKHRRIEAPGWTMGWSWAKKEVIWNMFGSQTTEQGDCSKYKGNVPHSCKKTPTVVDLLPGTPYNQQIANCCKGGVLNAGAVSSFQLAVGAAGNSKRSVRVPGKFTLLGPGRGYTCGRTTVVRPTKFLSADRRRVTQAMMTWKVTCRYSQA